MVLKIKTMDINELLLRYIVKHACHEYAYFEYTLTASQFHSSIVKKLYYKESNIKN